LDDKELAMWIDFHLHRFDWIDAPSDIAPRIAHLAGRAEGVGVRTLSVMDHFFQMDSVAPADDPMLECYTTLAFIAGRTETLRLRPLVTGVTYRHPGVLAKTMTTLDVVSRGRAELGVGAAWYEREHLGLGVPFPSLAERFEWLEETVQICLQMWSDDNGPFRGRHFALEETLCSPMPVCVPRPRILIGGGGETKTLALVARYADACNIFGDPVEVSHKLDVLQRHCDGIGRDIGEIEVTGGSRGLPADATTDDIVRAAEALAAVGVGALVASPVGDDPTAHLETVWGPAVERLADVEPLRL
jgi:F420-dependent oxidoreductase-like protein